MSTNLRIYISGISGTGMGPLALVAKQAGMDVCGSDLTKGAIYDELIQAGITVKIGEQDGEFLAEKMVEGLDWFVHTSAVSDGHPELELAKNSGVKVSKRDDFTAYLVEELGLKMVAVAGTHGKTTTTAMIIWAALKLGLPIAYIVGTTLQFAPSGTYHAGDKYFIYEADEYDRNFLKYHPWLAVIPVVSYDHPDIYATREEYLEAFAQFEGQSERVVKIDGGKLKNGGDFARFLPDQFELAGEKRREDAALAAEATLVMMRDMDGGKDAPDRELGKIIEVMNEFPGVGRRFERVFDGVYTDYAHHPEEIAATIGVAREEAARLGKKGVVVVYEPHQNTRQHEVKDGYASAFVGADKVFWLPTYLTREDESLPIINPGEFVERLGNKEVAEVAELSDELAERLREMVKSGYLVVLMTAGPADGWLRYNLE